jgi:catalase
MSEPRNLTSAAGCPIANTQTALTAGSRGPLLMQDVQLLEQMQHFNRERIPERVVHAKGSGAYGTFTVTRAIPEYTKAKFLSQVGLQTEVFLSFSTVAGEKGAADAERDVRGFAVKFYTEEGNWDLVEAIDRGEYPSWTVKVQIMTEAQAKTFQWNPFDLTKVWPHSDYPLMEIGVLELNRNPANYFAEVEQAAFSPSVFPPGIGPSPDKVLQARLMSYPDAQRYRIGANYQQLPVNQPRCPVMHYQRDGAMSTGYGGSNPNYYPNSDDTAPKEVPTYSEPGLALGDVVADRYDSREDDNYTQAGMLWRVLDGAQQQRTAQAIATTLGKAEQPIQMRQLCHFFRADAEYGQRVAEALGIKIDPAMLQEQP